MENPLRGIRLENKFFNYEKGSFSKSIGLKNSASNTQDSKSFSVLGGTLASFSIALLLENSYTPKVDGVPSPDGATVWNGVSRLFDLERDLTAKGVSMPLTFVTPYGATYSVIPTGALDTTEYLESPQDSGVEFRCSISLASS